MNNKRVFSGLLCAVGAFTAFFTVELFIFARTKIETVFQNILLILSAIVIAFLAVMLVLEAYLLKDREPNYFLYDKTLGKNIAVDNLTFKMLNDKMTLYISQIGETEESLWIDNTLDKPEKIGTPSEFRTLLAYKMLYNLADFDSDRYWLAFYTLGDNTVQSIANALESNKDNEMASTLLALKNSFDGSLDDIKDFLLNNKTYLERRMLRFVRNNVELFY